MESHLDPIKMKSGIDLKAIIDLWSIKTPSVLDRVEMVDAQVDKVEAYWYALCLNDHGSEQRCNPTRPIRCMVLSAQPTK